MSQQLICCQSVHGINVARSGRYEINRCASDAMLDLFRPLLGAAVVGLCQRSQFGPLVAQEITTEEPRHSSVHLIANKRPGWNGEDVIKFLQSALFGLWNQAEDQREGHYIESAADKSSARLVESSEEKKDLRKEPKCAGRTKSREEAWKCQGEN